MQYKHSVRRHCVTLALPNNSHMTV